MRWTGLSFAAGALALAAWLAAGGAEPPGPMRRDGAALLGGGAPEAPLVASAPVLRFSVPAGGPARLVLELRGAARPSLALASLLGVPGAWPLDGAAGAPAAPFADGLALASAAPVPEPGGLGLVLLGAAALAAWRTRRGAAGPAPARLAP